MARRTLGNGIVPGGAEPEADNGSAEPDIAAVRCVSSVRPNPVPVFRLGPVSSSPIAFNPAQDRMWRIPIMASARFYLHTNFIGWPLRLVARPTDGEESLVIGKADDPLRSAIIAQPAQCRRVCAPSRPSR